MKFMIHWCHTDDEGRFEIKGLMSGLTYEMYASNESNSVNEDNDFTIDLTTAKPGETIELGDVPGPSVGENTAPTSTSTMAKPNIAPPSETIADVNASASPASVIRGIAQGSDEKPIRDAMIAILANKRVGRTGMQAVSLGETRSDSDGEFNLDAKFTDDMHSPRLLVRSNKLELKIIDLEVKSLKDQYLVELKPPQQLQIRLVDLEGQPADNLTLDWFFFRNLADRPAVVPPRLMTDAKGNVTIKHLAAGDGIWLEVLGDERFAPQTLSINTGEPEKRPAHDATYRHVVKNVPVDEVVTIPLSPAQLFAGQVILGDSDEPAAGADVSIWSSQQEFGGSMIKLDTKTDSQGRFRLNPYPGVRFGIQVYPQEGSPYQTIEMRDLRWTSDERTSAMEIRLPKGTIAEGRVTDEATGEPIPGVYVQYLADSRNSNQRPGFIEGWQAMVRTDEDGQFRVSALPGKGTLIVHAGKSAPYVMKSLGSRNIRLGKPGGTRYYAHAFEKIQLAQSKSENQAISIVLEPSMPLLLHVVDSIGNPTARASYTSVLTGSPQSIFYRGFSEQIIAGVTTIHGLGSGENRRIVVLNEDQMMGATAVLVGGQKTQTIDLQPVGRAAVRFIDSAGDPIADKQTRAFCNLEFIIAERLDLDGDKAPKATYRSDTDFYVNFNRTPQALERETDNDGKVKFANLIPGLKYQIGYTMDGESQTKTFTTEPGKTLDLGEIVIDDPEDS